MLTQTQIRQAWSPACRGPWASVYLYGGGRAVVRFSAVEATKALNECLKRWAYATRYKDTGAYVCLAEETEVLTKQGICQIGDLVGQEVELLTRDPKLGGPGRWVKTTIEAYGKDVLRKITLTSSGVEKVIYATPNHRWYTKGVGTDPKNPLFECITDELKPGYKLAPIRPQSIASRTTPSPIGIAAGLVFGDGTLDQQQARIQLCGEKNIKLLRYFPEAQTVDFPDDDRYNEPTCVVRGLPKSWKIKGPDIEDGPSTLYGWLVGYFAADGRVTKLGIPELNSYNKDNLILARNVALRCGITSRPITSTKKTVTTPSGKTYNVTQYNLKFHKKYLDESFFIIDEHKARFIENISDREPNRWQVVSVEETDRYEEVYCAEVPDTECFALADDILTGNCRLKVGGNGYSNHSFGTAIDINWQLNPYGGSRYHMPYAMAVAICKIRTNNGKQVWNWGGFWRGTRDWMHFEIVCRPSDLATGINWNTVPGKTVPAYVPKAPAKPKPVEEEKKEEDEFMAMYVQRVQTGAIYEVTGPFVTHLDPVAWKTKNTFHKFATGKDLPLWKMSETDWNGHMYGKVDTWNSMKPVMKRRS